MIPISNLPLVAKSRSRKKTEQSASGQRTQVGGHPQVALLAEKFQVELGEALADWDFADPTAAIAAPAVFMDIVAATFGLPKERCADDCVILGGVYAQFGISAQIRVAVVTITDTYTGQCQTHGTFTPSWKNGLLNGHLVLWLPDTAHLVDSSIGQFLFPSENEPIIASCPPPRDNRNNEGEASRRMRITIDSDDLTLTYILAPFEVTAPVMADPAIHNYQEDHLRRSINNASAVISTLATLISPDRTRHIPHQRVSALINAVRDIPVEYSPNGDWQFAHPGPPARLIGLDRLPVPAGTPPIATAALY